MKSNDILYSKGNNDECNTPKHIVEILLEFMNPFKDKIIWCPFDTKDSNFVKTFKEEGFNVVNSHISEGKDFYNYEPNAWDVIISNPPFTNKRKIFERCMNFNKPFALIMTNVWLNDKAPLDVFGEELQLLFIKDRIHFLDNKGNDMGRPTFSSSYYCRKFLPKQIIIRGVRR